MAVGVGEAGGVPPSYAIITDYFPPGIRGRALALFNLGPPIGQALGVAFGASIAAAYSWRSAFVAVGVVGIATAAIVLLFVREPARGRLDAPRPDSAAQTKAPFWPTCRRFFADPVLLRLSIATGVTQIVTYGTLGFAVLFLIPPIVVRATGAQALALFDAFYRAGALVFGGGHVVLPLLQAEVVAPGWVSNETFLAGYGLTQAVPGPLFTFAAYLGAVMLRPPNGAPGGLLALLAIFAPSFLLVSGLLPFWDALRRRQAMQSMLRGVNAAVVGVLLAALYTPVWTGGVHAPAGFGLALAAFLALTVWTVPPWLVVLAGALAASGLAAAGVTL